MFLFLVKKVLGKLLMPLPFAAFLLLLAGVASVFGRKKLARGLIAAVLFLVFFLSLPAVGYRIIAPLERQYAQYDNSPVAYVVVHGGYHKSDPYQPITSLLSRVSMARLMEGVRIYQLNPGAKLLLSGYHPRDPISHAEAMAQVAETYGVPRADIVLEPDVKDTEEEVIAWLQYIDGDNFAVVTSAMHMPRTMLWYEIYGAKPVAAPTAFETRGSGKVDWYTMVPHAETFWHVEMAWHEILGIAWAKLRSGY